MGQRNAHVAVWAKDKGKQKRSGGLEAVRPRARSTVLEAFSFKDINYFLFQYVMQKQVFFLNMDSSKGGLSPTHKDTIHYIVTLRFTGKKLTIRNLKNGFV